jgi:hypothetical protein
MRRENWFSLATYLKKAEQRRIQERGSHALDLCRIRLGMVRYAMSKPSYVLADKRKREPAVERGLSATLAQEGRSENLCTRAHPLWALTGQKGVRVAEINEL